MGLVKLPGVASCWHKPITIIINPIFITLMNFQNLSRIEKPSLYIDTAIKEALKSAASRRTSSSLKGNKKNISATIEEKKVVVFYKALSTKLELIEKSFPSIDNLPIFYQELIDATISKDKLKKSLSSISWIRSKANDFFKMALHKIKRAKHIPEINKARKEFFGRTSSLLERREADFEFLEESRKKMKSFPSVKENMATVCICGYPNVGKSTLLTKITTARPEINVYPFTTKGLMMGYIDNKIQLIDTPGTFGAEFLKMNYIEKQSYLALKHLADLLVFVLDLSESCGYEVELQETLLKQLKELFKHKRIVIYLSKCDMIPKEKIIEFKNTNKNYDIVSDSEKLKLLVLHL